MAMQEHIAGVKPLPNGTGSSKSSPCNKGSYMWTGIRFEGVVQRIHIYDNPKDRPKYLQGRVFFDLV